MKDYKNLSLVVAKQYFRHFLRHGVERKYPNRAGKTVMSVSDMQLIKSSIS